MQHVFCNSLSQATGMKTDVIYRELSQRGGKQSAFERTFGVHMRCVFIVYAIRRA